MRTIMLKVDAVPVVCQFGVFGVRSSGTQCSQWEYATVTTADGSPISLNKIKQGMREACFNNLHEVRLIAGSEDGCYLPTEDIGRTTIRELENATVWDKEMIRTAGETVVAASAALDSDSQEQMPQTILHTAICDAIREYIDATK